MRVNAKNMGLGLVVALLACATANAQHIGKYVPIPAGSEADHAVQEITAATDPAQKLALINKFASGPGQGEMALVTEDLYVNYYLTQKDYAKAFEHGDKLFALDPDNMQNAVNMVRAASETGDADKLLVYGAKVPGILQRFKEQPAPSGASPEQWKEGQTNALQANADNMRYIYQAVLAGIYQTKDPVNRAAQLTKYADALPDSPYANEAIGVAATSYQQAQNVPKMLEVANGLLIKDPNNLRMLLLLADYYGENNQQLDKAEAYAKKAAGLADTAPKPEGVVDDQWKQQTSLQKGLALSALGEVNLQKKDNTAAVQNLQAAAPLVKGDNLSYAKNQYRLAYAFLNLKKLPEAKQALTEAASVNSPYKQLALDKLKSLPAKAPVTRKRAS
jgi:tetratricopeptide (TPR) repeat protein